MKRKHLAIIIVVGILFAATIFTTGCTSNVNNAPTPSVASPTRDPKFVPKNTSGYRTYSNRSEGISIQYPSSWRVLNASASEIVGFNVSSVPDMSFTVLPAYNFSGTATTLNDFSQSLLPMDFTEFKLLNTTSSTLSGYPAQKQVFTFMNDDKTITQGMIQVTLVNRTGYGLFYVALQSHYPTYLGIVQNMTQSFSITK